jgi:transcriptional regulator of arginine metabolism
MKNQRQQAIIKLISDNEIETQDELISKLNAAGYKVTQATISRDIRELKLSKVLSSAGNYHYALPGQSEVNRVNNSFKHAYTSAILGTESVGNIIVIKTPPGLAQAVAAGIDSINSSNILGCVAGDDTIITVARNTDEAMENIYKLRNEINGK